MCDGHSHDPDTGFGGYTNHFTGKHYFNEEDERCEMENVHNDPEVDHDPDDSWT